MEKRSLKYFAESCDGVLAEGSPETTATGISTDSRSVRAGELFVALRGERFDGHDYLDEVFKKGAVAAVVEESWFGNVKTRNSAMPGGAYIVVRNTREALGKIAARYRQDFNIPVIAVCGSNGKTTTKELIASVLGVKFNVLKSAASFNNDIGVPLTLLNLGSEHRVAVVEAGTNHPGELRPLLQIIKPKFGVITSIGREHLGFFKSMDGVVKEEGQIAECLPADGKLYIHVNNEWAEKILHRSRAPVITIGSGGTLNWRANVLHSTLSGTKFAVESDFIEYNGEYEVPLTGRHQATNALIAIAIGAGFGLSKAEIQRGLLNVTQPSMRMQIEDWNGVRILNDAYNANPDSMAAALTWLSGLDCAGKKIAVIGTMAELGEHSEHEHEEIGKLVADLKIDIIFAIGEFAECVARGARKSGNKNVEIFEKPEDVAERLKQICSENDIVLIKASRSARLEQIVKILKS